MSTMPCSIAYATVATFRALHAQYEACSVLCGEMDGRGGEACAMLAHSSGWLRLASDAMKAVPIIRSLALSCRDLTIVRDAAAEATSCSAGTRVSAWCRLVVLVLVLLLVLLLLVLVHWCWYCC